MKTMIFLLFIGLFSSPVWSEEKILEQPKNLNELNDILDRFESDEPKFRREVLKSVGSELKLNAWFDLARDDSKAFNRIYEFALKIWLESGYDNRGNYISQYRKLPTVLAQRILSLDEAARLSVINAIHDHAEKASKKDNMVKGHLWGCYGILNVLAKQELDLGGKNAEQVFADRDLNFKFLQVISFLEDNELFAGKDKGQSIKEYLKVAVDTERFKQVILDEPVFDRDALISRLVDRITSPGISLELLQHCEELLGAK